MTPAGRPGGRWRPRWRTVLVLALVIVPTVEIAVIVAVGRVIGAWPTFLLLLVESLLGAWLVRREGARAWAGLRDALRSGQMPSRELADAALVLIGGTLLLTPGFVTDAVGFGFVLPLTRPVARRMLEVAVANRLLGAGSPWVGGGSWAGSGPRRPAPGAGDVIEGEVVDEHEPPEERPGR